MNWSTDRRGLMKAGGALFAGLTFGPKMSWAVAGDTLRIRVDADLLTLDPKDQSGGIEDIIMRCTLVTLLRLPDMRESFDPIPYAAEKWEWTDPSTIDFTLLEGLKWTGDFGPVTPEDVKFSFERIRDSGGAWAYMFEKLKEVEVIDGRSGRIHLTEPFKPIEVIALPYYGGNIVCKAAVEKAGGSFTTEFPAQCGQYLFDSWEQNAKVTLVANPDWPGEKPNFAKIEFYIVTDDQAALLAFEANSFDFTRLAVTSATEIKANPISGATLIEAPSTRYVWLTININSDKLQDLRVRQAIQYAYDGDAVLQGAYNGLTTRSAGVIQPGSKFARPANKISRDVEKAKALLAEAGVTDLTLQLACLPDATSLAIAQITQASLAEAGITIEIQPTEPAVYWVLGDKTQGDGYKSLELVLMSYSGGVDPIENLVWFRPDQIGAGNWSFFDSPEFEDLYNKVLVETDVVTRREMFNRMEDLMEDSGGFVFICFEPYLAVHRDNLTTVILPDGHPDPTRFKFN